MIHIKAYLDLLPSTRDQLDAYIQAEFGHIPIVNQITWAVPQWAVVYWIGTEIGAFCHIVEREILLDGKRKLAFGVNNVITPSRFRGKGYATSILGETESFAFEKLGSEVGLLLCAKPLIPYYQKLGWYEVDCPVHFQQPMGRKLWEAHTMLRSKGELLQPIQIDLNGLPW